MQLSSASVELKELLTIEKGLLYRPHGWFLFGIKAILSASR